MNAMQKLTTDFSVNLNRSLSAGITVDGQGPSLVLLHSSLSSAKQWLSLVSILKEQFTVINIDLLGYGGADQVTDIENYSFDFEVQRILSAVELVSPRENFHLLGHSCGGAIALKISAEMPDRVLSLSLYEPVAFHLFATGSSERQQVIRFSEQVHQLSDELATQAFVDYWNGSGYFDSLPKQIQQLMVFGINKVVLDFKGIFAEHYGVERLELLTMPCLLLYGKYSPALSQLLSRKIASHLPHASYQQVTAGHMAPISHPSLVEPLISDFLLSVVNA